MHFCAGLPGTDKILFAGMHVQVSFQGLQVPENFQAVIV